MYVSIQFKNKKVMSQECQQGLTSSQSNILTLYQEEKEVSKAFEIDNFYQNERLNLKELKQRIDKMKQLKYMNATVKTNYCFIKQHHKQYDLSSNGNDPSFTSTINQSKATDKLKDKAKEEVASKRRLTETKQRRDIQTCTLAGKQFKSSDHTARQQKDKSQRYPEIESNLSSFYNEGQQVTKYKLLKPQPAIQIKYQTLASRQKQKTPIYHRLQARINSRMQKSKTQINESRLSMFQSKSSDFWNLQGKIVIKKSSDLQQYEQNIVTLWQHYELLSRILQLVHGDFNKIKYYIVKYRDAVCSSRLEFIRNIMDQICLRGRCKKQVQFLKRLKKGILISRLSEHISIIFLALNYYSQNISIPNLNNLIGYASSNLINIIKLMSLLHIIQQPLKLSPSIEEKMLVISSFQVGSYGTQLTKIPEVMLRIEQNNNVMIIIKNKIDLDKQFMQIVTAFLKVSQAEAKTLEEYPRNIFEYLSFALAQRSLSHHFQQVEMAPSPYLNLQKRLTLVIEPWNVLLAIKGETILIRAYSEHFLTEISRYCNLIYWTDLMPNQINRLIERLPTGYILYRHHCRNENGVLIKIAARIGCDVDDTIMIDRSEANFSYDRDRGIELPWNGTRRDLKLLDLLDQIMPFVNENSFNQNIETVRLKLRKGKNKFQSKIFIHNGIKMKKQNI